ncbi:unnamed protein product [Anisakis simplex]|uniref:Phosphofurin acidic cluster sorting protein 2 n=1 Tax=Anisakis simplex TaxID=6269 RepID=A0A0M3JUQ9_ANISI|nr:unnamed protein product [Anisakis simplex]
MELNQNRIVPMRLFANWETGGDRASTSAVQRMFTMALSRLSINPFPDQQCTLVVTVKLQGYKRTLRSNDFAVTAVNGKLDVDLNISFTIQYPHFLKRKSNILQILLQRRKRYKNRQIPGYKTLAIGTVNLAEILQNGSLREILLYDPDAEKEELPTNNLCIGRLLLASCQSQAFEVENEVVTVQRIKEKYIESGGEEEEESSTDMPYSDNDHDQIPDSARSRDHHKRRMKMRDDTTRQRKLAARKNLKQKFASLLKKFRLPEEVGVDETSQSAGVAPTAEELEELFEELEDLSDSGPEMVMDNLSIVSNPRPGLRPYFASTSSRELLPAINDDRCQSDESEDEEWSGASEIENNNVVLTGAAAIGNISSFSQKRPASGGVAHRGTALLSSCRATTSLDSSAPLNSNNNNGNSDNRTITQSISSVINANVNNNNDNNNNTTPTTNIPSSSSMGVTVSGGAAVHPLVHTSLTLGSISQSASSNSGNGNGGDHMLASRRKISLAEVKARSDPFTPRTFTISDQLSSVLRDDEPWSVEDRIWICSMAELPMLASLDPSLCLLDCSSFSDCKLLISSIVAKIQKFCNTSSSTPPCTVLGVIGGDRLLSYVLRAYVESLQNKQPDWINFLKFCVISPPSSAIGKTLTLLDGGRSSFFLKDSFERGTSPDYSPTDLKVLTERLRGFSEGATHRLPIGEAMLQFHNKSGEDKDACTQVFVPFLSEVHLGQTDDDYECVLLSARFSDENQVVNVTAPGVGNTTSLYCSPPSSPHSVQRPISDSQDLQIEYWISTNPLGTTGVSDIQQQQQQQQQPMCCSPGIGPSSVGSTVASPPPVAGTVSSSLPASVLSSSSKKDPQPVKCSLRSAFRLFTITRNPHCALLSFQFIKEKKREKMLQKLGMKKGQKSDSETQTPAQTISNVTRLICSGKHPLNVCIDGCSWSGVRFFQTSSQWQTHVKQFPICLPA